MEYVLRMRKGTQEQIKTSVRKSQRIIRFGGPRHRWDDNIKRNLKGIRYKGVDWTKLTQNLVQ